MRGTAGQARSIWEEVAARHLARTSDCTGKVPELDFGGDCDTSSSSTKSAPAFADRSFDVCGALDVMKHLDQVPLIMDEMFHGRTLALLYPYRKRGDLPAICRNLCYHTTHSRRSVTESSTDYRSRDDRSASLVAHLRRTIIRVFLWTERVKSCEGPVLYYDDAFSIKRSIAASRAGERLFLKPSCSSVWVRVVKEARVSGGIPKYRPGSQPERRWRCLS